MKILHIVGDSKWGGGGHIILALSQMAQRQGWDVDILATDPVCQRMFRASNVGIVDLDVIWRDISPLRDYLGLRRLRRFLETHRYDLVHTHTSKAGFVGRIAARLAGTPAVVHTAHSFPFHEDSGRLASLAYWRLEQFAARYCDRIVTVSDYHRQWGLRWKVGSSRQLVAIANGIPETQVSVTKDLAEVRRELKLADSELLFLTPGRLFWGKGLEYLIDAIPLLAGRLSKPFRIALAGEGPLRPALEQRAASLGVAGHILFLGFRCDIANLLHAADVVVLPSLHEGLSISLLEAMAAQKPVVATSIGGNLEPTGNGLGALIVAPKSSRELAEAMTRFATDPALAEQKAANARRLFLNNHTQQVMLDRYLELYLALTPSARIAGRSCPPSSADDPSRWPPVRPTRAESG